MTIQEGNKLIAEFMGFDSEPFENNGGKGYHVKLKGCPQKGNIKYSCAYYGSLQDNIDKVCSWEMFYHESWDWLMPVVEKIENIEEIGAQAYIDITAFGIKGYCSGHIVKGLGLFARERTGRRFNNEQKLKAVWEIVIEFINWYNTQKDN